MKKEKNFMKQTIIACLFPCSINRNGNRSFPRHESMKSSIFVNREYFWIFGFSDIELNDDSSGITFSYEASNPDISIYGSLEHNIITLIMDKIGSTNVTITINERLVILTRTAFI